MDPSRHSLESNLELRINAERSTELGKLEVKLGPKQNLKGRRDDLWSLDVCTLHCFSHTESSVVSHLILLSSETKVHSNTTVIGGVFFSGGCRGRNSTEPQRMVLNSRSDCLMVDFDFCVI